MLTKANRTLTLRFAIESCVFERCVRSRFNARSHSDSPAPLPEENGNDSERLPDTKESKPRGSQSMPGA
jgi:hypothetical protein